MNDRVSFQCGSCNARIKAPARLAGRPGHCPACGETVVVPKPALEEAGPILVLDDEPYPAPQTRRTWH
jgi:hypothetical protein